MDKYTEARIKESYTKSKNLFLNKILFRKRLDNYNFKDENKGFFAYASLIRGDLKNLKYNNVFSTYYYELLETIKKEKNLLNEKALNKDVI
ncbi:hypothetical protein [Borreliella valaisiana]|uniref:Uncharacterized protein n=1 Tax=Borreliella valaisiana VS116 TaxID=445987 RepID=C0R967_BORVA|nr:hypothetical protein [Borreliella valaisiana]ACN53050.1 hypothetical protein BVAVS116_H0010 [Borreliella valaisiana VS116]